MRKRIIHAIAGVSSAAVLVSILLVFLSLDDATRAAVFSMAGAGLLFLAIYFGSYLLSVKFYEKRES